MATLIVKSNASQATVVTIDDVGVLIPDSGGIETFTTVEEQFQLQGSEDLRAFLTDDAHGAGSSTLILNDGSSDISQADALFFLDAMVLPDASNDFGVVKNNASGQIDTSLTFDGIATVSNLIAGNDVNLNSNKLTNVAAGTAGTDGINLDQLNTAVTQGKVWKEAVLHSNQLDSVNDALSQAIAFYLDGQPTAADTFIITDGVTTETFTFVAAAPGAFDVLIGASTDDTMDNLVSTINTDSTLWSAVQSTRLESINDGSGTSTAGEVTTIYRTIQSSTSFADRIHGSLSTASFGQYVNFNGEDDYTLNTSTQLPIGDPAQKEFGFGRDTANLTPGETHITLESDEAWTWDADDLVWNLTQTSITVGQSGKIFQFGTAKTIPGGGTRYLESGGIVGTAAPIYMLRPGKLSGASITVDQIDASRAFKLSVQKNGVEVESVALPLSTTAAADLTFTTTYIAGDLIRLAVIRTSGAGSSSFDEVHATLEIIDN